MKLLSVFVTACLLLVRVSFAQSVSPTATATTPPAPVQAPKSSEHGKAASAKSRASDNTAQLEAALVQLTQSNRDLLDLLKKQQAVLEDIQFDRRLQSRQIQSLEDRLEETLLQKSQLENKVANLEADASAAPANPSPSEPSRINASTSALLSPPSLADTTPPPPATYLPPPETESTPGTKSWHRLFTLKGENGQNSGLFRINGRIWRVFWHNQDKPGKASQNTSALFINAFPKDDTIPQKVCSKVGSGGDSTELQGPGNYYLRIEASGGTWELAVEDFR